MCAGKAKLCGRVRDASSEAGAAAVGNVHVFLLAGPCSASNAAVCLGLILFWSLCCLPRVCFNALHIGFIAFFMFYLLFVGVLTCPAVADGECVAPV